MVANGLATYEDDILTPTEWRDAIDELGPVTKIPRLRSTTKATKLTPAVMVDGHHVNLRAYGEFAEQVTYGLPQEGDVFERTHLLQIIQDLDFVPITEEGVPAGYEGPNGVRLFDPGRESSFALACGHSTMTEAERLAAEASRLLNEPLLVEALDGIMADAFAEFKAMSIGPDTIYDVVALQQRIIATQEIHDRIDAKITASGQRDGGVVVEKPTA
jgi:hypothetical protein